jgi:hypothetical protein
LFLLLIANQHYACHSVTAGTSSLNDRFSGKCCPDAFSVSSAPCYAAGISISTSQHFFSGRGGGWLEDWRPAAPKVHVNAPPPTLARGALAPRMTTLIRRG